MDIEAQAVKGSHLFTYKAVNRCDPFRRTLSSGKHHVPPRCQEGVVHTVSIMYIDKVVWQLAPYP